MFDGPVNPAQQKGWFRWSSARGLACGSARTKRGRLSSVEIDIPCCGIANRRSSTSVVEEVKDFYRDGDLIIDRCGLRRIPATEEGKEQCIETDSCRLNDRFAPLGMHINDQEDTLSVASTEFGEAAPISSSRYNHGTLATTKVQTLHSYNGDFSAFSPPSSGSSSPATGISQPRSNDNKPHCRNHTEEPSAHRSCETMRLDTLDKREILGRGSSGTVYRAVDRSGHTWAIKEILRQSDEEKHRMTIDELRTAYGVAHPCIVGCHEVYYASGVFSLVLDYMDGGSLLDAMKAASAAGGGGAYAMPLDALAHVGRCIAAALAYLHDELEVVHRDVKPGNILLSTRGHARLGDLGICTRPGEVTSLLHDTSSAEASTAAGADGIAPHTSASSSAFSSSASASPHTASACASSPPAPPSTRTSSATAWIGTVTYMSPERLLGEAYSFSADVWSLGIVLAEAALGRYPYALSPAAPRALQFWDLLDLVLSGPGPADMCRAEYQARAGGGEGGGCAGGRELAELVEACLQRDCLRRLPARELLHHPFLAGGGNGGGGGGGDDEDCDEGRAALARWYAAAVVPAAAATATAAAAAAQTTVPAAAAAAAAAAGPLSAAAAAAGQGGVERLQQRFEEGLGGLLSLFGRGAALA